MTEIRTQPLSVRFANIISVMLGMLRAQGLRSLLYLPQLWLFARELRRLGDELAALFAAYEAGTLRLVAPAVRTESQALQATPAPAAGDDCAPATDRARPHRARTLSPRRRPRPQPAPAKPARAGVRARPYPTPGPQSLPGPVHDILVTARCS